ncbi:MAG: hypothetical protein ACFFDC_14440 [Promethearchaeota archaeon]
MSFIKEKLDELDASWKIAFKKSLLVFGCYLGVLIICNILLMGLFIVLYILNPFIPQEMTSMFFNDVMFRFILIYVPLLGLFTGLFKALLDILTLTREEVPSS